MPRGPLAVRWLGVEVAPPRAGALGSARLAFENAGTAPWRSGIHLAYHWLDERGNPIVWDGLRTPLPHPVEPGARVELDARLRAPIPPGRYRLAWDLVEEHRLWLAEIGGTPLERELDVAPRIRRRLAARGGDPAALAAQEEPLVSEGDADAVAFLGDGARPAPDWSRRVLDAHEEGYAAVGGSIEPVRGLLGRAPAELEPWAPGPGRVPTFAHLLLCPSIVRGVEPRWTEDVAGLPALETPPDEPWLYDDRIAIRVRARRS